MSPSDQPSTVERLLRDARARLAPGDAELLLAEVLQRPRGWLVAFSDAQVDATTVGRYGLLVARRQRGEPIAYLVGRRGFWKLDLAVTPDVLIPRADTELLVELALARIAPDAPVRVLDLGTGSGAVALAIAHERPRAQLTATDASPAALQVARGNATTLGLQNVQLRQGDWYAAVGEARFDVIVSNPPYIEQGDPHLAQGDLRFEPPAALTSGVDGLEALRVVVGQARMHLADDGWLMVEHGWNQGAAVRGLFAQAGFIDIATAQDLEERERVTLGRAPTG